MRDGGRGGDLYVVWLYIELIFWSSDDFCGEEGLEMVCWLVFR